MNGSNKLLITLITLASPLYHHEYYYTHSRTYYVFALQQSPINCFDDDFQSIPIYFITSIQHAINTKNICRKRT